MLLVMHMCILLVDSVALPRCCKNMDHDLIGYLVEVCVWDYLYSYRNINWIELSESNYFDKLKMKIVFWMLKFFLYSVDKLLRKVFLNEIQIPLCKR